MSDHRTMTRRHRLWSATERSQAAVGFRTCERGAVAVEMSLLALPLIMMIIGILQFYALHVMQSTLSDALFQSASSPELVLLAGDKAAYKTLLCNKTAFPSTCNSNLKLEMQPLQSVPTARTEITGTTFNAGSSNDVLLLRASTDGVQFMPGIPSLRAKASVIFRRPS